MKVAPGDAVTPANPVLIVIDINEAVNPDSCLADGIVELVHVKESDSF